MKKVLLFWYFLLTLNQVYSQDTVRFLQPKFGLIFSDHSFNGLNNIGNFLESNGVNKFKDFVLIDEIGFYMRDKCSSSYSSFRFIYSFVENEEPNILSKYSASGFYYDINFDLLTKDHSTLLYPKIDLSMISSRLEICDKNNNYTPASSFIENMTGEKTLNQMKFII